MFQFIHAADLHLDSAMRKLERYDGAPVEEMRGATRRALQNLVELAIDRKVDFLIIAGDIYDDEWKDHNTGLFFNAQMIRLREAGIPVVMISGNHDAANRMTKSLRLPDNVDLLPHGTAGTSKLKKLSDLGVAVHGRSFAQAAERENLALTYPDRLPGFFNLGVLHTSLTGFEGHEPYAPCTPDHLLQKQYDYWALGHVHNRTEPQAGQAPIVFPGNLQGRNIRETGPKGCYLVSVNDRLESTLQFQPVDVARWTLCEIHAEQGKQLEDVLNSFSDQLAKAVASHAGMPLAVRVQVVASPELFQQFHSHSTDWKNEIRAAALEVSGGVAWVEEIRFDLARSNTVLFSETMHDGPLGELRKCLAQIHSDDAELLALGDELADLAAKLPGELTRGEEGLNVKDPVQLRQWVTEVEALLWYTLTEGRGK